MTESDALEFYYERAAIIEYDGGRKRFDAEYAAAILTFAFCKEHGVTTPKLSYFLGLSFGRDQVWSDEAGQPVYQYKTPYS